MKKRTDRILGIVCYTVGILLALYVGAWQMLIEPIGLLIYTFRNGDLTLTILVMNIIKIALSTTVSGIMFTFGYVGYNHFKGPEDPDWELFGDSAKKRDQEEKQNG